MEFILKSDTKKRAAAYWLEHHYQEIELGEEIFDVESEYQKQIIENKGKEAYDEDLKKFQKKKEALARIIKSKPVFQEIDNDRKMKLSLKKKKSKNVFMYWYEVCSDVKSFKGMMKETGYEMYYSSIYGGLSYETHALNSTMDMSIGTDGICLKPILSATNELTAPLSSHILSEISLLADDIGIIDHGALLEEESLAELEQKSSKHIRFTLSDTAQAARILERNFHENHFSIQDDHNLRLLR